MDTQKQNFGFPLGWILTPLILAGLACNLMGVIGPEPDTEDSHEGIGSEQEDEDSGPVILRSTSGEPWYEGCGDRDFDPVTHFEVMPVPAMSEPEPRVPFHDPVFHTCLVRVTDTKQDKISGDPSGGMKNEYARVQAFNADGSLVMVFTTEGNWYLYDAVSLQPLGQLPILHEPRWDAVDPDLLYYSEETRLMSYRLSNGKQEQRLEAMQKSRGGIAQQRLTEGFDRLSRPSQQKFFA